MASATAKKEFLDSDRLNFLVWRYLLEGNYRETAAKFQKEWHIPEPHKHFDFAPHVKSHALVSAINRGLLYYSLERSFASSNTKQVENAAPEPQGIFGPLVTEPPPVPRAEDVQVEEARANAAAAAADDEASRKRQIDKQLQNGSPAKKAKLSNGFGGAPADPDASLPTPMEIDNNNENQHAYPSPMERESATTPVPRTDGPEQGTQVDKVEELAPETTFLQLSPDHSVDDSTVDQALPGHENPIVLHCEWNPSNPSILAAAGTDALARIWTVSRATASSDPVSDHVNEPNRPYKDLADEDLSRTATVTAMAWNHDGTAIAIATESENKARVSIWAPDGTSLLRYNVQEPPVIKLRWSPNSSLLLGIAPDNGGTLITVFSAVTSNTVSHFLADHDLTADPLDAAWTNDTDFLLCGGDLLIALHCNDSEIVNVQKFETKKDDNFVQIQYDSLSKLAATASEKGVIDLWEESGERRTISAHIGLVTSLMWQPLQSVDDPDERLLASGGEDGAITIWNARKPDSKPKCSMTMDLPVVALSFTPDGAFIAGATADRILIWKVGEHTMPRASWRRPPHPGWVSAKTNGETEEEDTHCLGWDTTGQKLAYGVNNRLAVINFR